MLLVGLTGGIGSGKSRVCQEFKKLGVPVIDTDQIARRLVGPGEKTLSQIAELFGPQVIDASGQLDRAFMRELVFHDAKRLEQLESLLHPLIRQEMKRQIEQLNAPYVILDIPLLIEKGWQTELDQVIVVDCTTEQQRQRTHARDGTSLATIDEIISRQVDRNTRLAAATEVIDNSGPISALQPQIENLHRALLRLADNN